MSRHGELQAEYFRYLAEHNVVAYGGAAVVICPLCTVEHKACRFTAGSLRCITFGCPNPHHST